jgi:large subunit ribosomal protein L20
MHTAIVASANASSAPCGLRESTRRRAPTVCLTDIEVDRKVLADIAVFDQEAFAALAQVAKEALASASI